ncbi:hypothetical protein D3C72_699590 [compost metagenome]
MTKSSDLVSAVAAATAGLKPSIRRWASVRMVSRMSLKPPEAIAVAWACTAGRAGAWDSGTAAWRPVAGRAGGDAAPPSGLATRDSAGFQLNSLIGASFQIQFLSSYGR